MIVILTRRAKGPDSGVRLEPSGKSVPFAFWTVHPLCRFCDRKNALCFRKAKIVLSGKHQRSTH